MPARSTACAMSTVSAQFSFQASGTVVMVEPWLQLNAMTPSFMRLPPNNRPRAVMSDWDVAEAMRNYSKGELAAQGRRAQRCLVRQPEAVIEPGKALEGVGLAALAQHLPVDFTRNAVRMIDVPHVAGFDRHPRGAQRVRAFVAPEGCFVVAVRVSDAIREADSIFDRHAGALGQRLQGGMRGIAEQHDAPLMPMPDRVSVADRLAPAQIEHRQQRLHGGVCFAVDLFQLGAVGLGVTPLGAGRPAEHRHDVEQRAAAERIMDNVEAWASP